MSRAQLRSIAQQRLRAPVALRAPFPRAAAETQAPQPWGYVLTNPATGKTAVRCDRHASTPITKDWSRDPIPFTVYFAACPCGCIVRNGRVSYKDSMTIAREGCLEITDPEAK